ncbi:MAG TPA: N-acetylmuramoyl-L-alanine amidase [Vicinamibacterales bacterium]
MKYVILAAIVLSACSVPAEGADTPRDMYTRAMAQERELRDSASHATAAQMRRVVASYERIVRTHPTSGYCDNALWQGGNLASLAYERFGNEADRKTSARLFAMLTKEYPTSKLVARANEALNALAGARPAAVAAVTGSVPPAAGLSAEAPPAVLPAVLPAAAPAKAGAQPKTGMAILKEIHRTVLPDGIRLTVDLDAEVVYDQQEIINPRRLFFDLKGVKAAPNLQDVSLKYDDDVVKEVRLGRHPQNTTRVVVDLEGVSGYTVYPLYGPYRLVIDFRRAVAAPMAATRPAAPPIAAPPFVATETRIPASLAVLPPVKPPVPETRSAPPEPPLLPSSPAGPKSLPPAAPAANSNGKFSLSRQLGLTVSRIVIDAGHGGHDPGAHGNGITEAELTLDVALRVEKLLQRQPGIEVVMTRDTDVFIPLQERTEIANREGADLFLSIHANASRNPQARGIETYFLNFAMNPEAEAVAARENAASGRAMHSLPDIVRAIALNNKINESRDLAETVQRSMAKRLAARNRALKDLGVKQAPFVVLIGAVMPSVLAEISFVTNKQDGALLKTQAYRQQIAQALFDAIVAYQQGLKRLNAAAGKKATQ